MSDIPKSEPAFFTVFERLGIAVAATLLLLVTPFFLGTGRMDESGVEIIDHVLDLVRTRFPSAEDIGEVCYQILLLVVAVGAFRTARRTPQIVATGMVCVVVINLLLLLHHTFANLQNYYEASGFLLWNLRAMWIVPEFLFPYFLALLCVYIAGEFHFVVRNRLMREELIIGENDGEAACLRARRRHQLVLAALGPRMPVWIAIGRALQQAVIPAWAVMAFYGILDRVSNIESSLPTPSIEKAGLSEQSSQIEFRLTENGKIFYKSSDGLLEQVELESMFRIADLESGAKRQILLRVARDAKYEHLIEIVSAAYRAGIPVVLAE